MVGCAIRLQNRKVEWLRSLLRVKFFGICDDHRDLRKNEKNLFCIDCNLCLCKHCVSTSSYCSSFHRRLQICRYVYHDVVRLQDIQKFFDCSKIQTYKINGEMAIHLNPRPQLKDIKAAKLRNGAECEGCGRHIHDLPNQFCSIACKVHIFSRMSKDKEQDMISIPLREFDALSWKENCDQSEYIDENRSSLSPTDQSSEVIQCSWLSSASRPKKLLHKRKGVPRRAPLC
ncbi:protein RGF1 INDUCIBLE TRANSCRIPTION FACTOR 1 [Apium graveolens]|uniref:protein RGF1 INDUCIBLE TRANSCRIPTION FACTOR 1 n=1 Tax=Apium graveolens TaxID=4045 RepID=UPI003D793367